MGQCCLRQAIGCARNLLEALCRDSSEEEVRKAIGSNQDQQNGEGPRPYIQPTNLKAIAREAALRGDTKTLFHALDLLERVVPIATFMDFCTELDELRPQGAAGPRTG